MIYVFVGSWALRNAHLFYSHVACFGHVPKLFCDEEGVCIVTIVYWCDSQIRSCMRVMYVLVRRLSFAALKL